MARTPRAIAPSKERHIGGGKGCTQRMVTSTPLTGTPSSSRDLSALPQVRHSSEPSRESILRVMPCRRTKQKAKGQETQDQHSTKTPNQVLMRRVGTNQREEW